MIPLFLGLTLVNLLSLLVAGVLGYLATHGHNVRPWHTLAGALATLICVGVHCIVFTYFIATAKWVQHAVAVKQLDATLAQPTRSFRRQAFPAALFAIATVFAAAVLGAARDNAMIARGWHGAISMLAFVANVAVATIEYRAIARNGRLIDSVLAQINR